MAIDKSKEIDDIFSTFNDEAKTGASTTDVPEYGEVSFVAESYEAFMGFLSYEISGLKVGVWLVFFTLFTVVSWLVWRKVNKAKCHSDKELYRKAKDYMHKAGDLERRTMPFSLLVVLMALLFVEASGFSYVFSDLMINDASEKMLQYTMIFGGFVVSIVLMFLTHFSGEEMHKMSVLKSIDNEMASLDPEALKQDKNRFPRNKISLENTFGDNDADTVVIPQYNRMEQKYFDWRKVGTNRHYIITIFTAILILSIGIGAMFVRFYVFDKDVDYYQNPIVAEAATFNVETDFLKSKSKGSVDKEAVEVPSYFMKQTELRDKYQRSSKVEAEKKASYVTYMVMMMLFFGIQAVGLISGVRFSFVGKESKKAYKQIAFYKEVA